MQSSETPSVSGHNFWHVSLLGFALCVWYKMSASSFGFVKWSHTQPASKHTEMFNPSCCVMQIVGFFLAIGAVSYSTLALGTSHIFTSGGGEEGSAQLPYRPDFFHLVYALASMYMAMLYTNWEISSNTTQFELSKGWISTWVKMGSKWFCEALYLWTVVAPAVCRGRDFT